MTGKLRDMMRLAGGEWVVSFTTPQNPGELFDTLRDKEVKIEIKKLSKGRSKDANSFCWALCEDIGKAMTPPVDKVEIYRTAIRAAGVCWQTQIPVFRLDDIRDRWESNGVGWFVEIVDDDEPGRKLVRMYFGSSTYTVDEMRILLDWLVDQAHQMEIPIPLSKADQEAMLGRWGK